MFESDARLPLLSIDVFTLFPAMFEGPFDESIVKRARAGGLIEIAVHNIRDWATDKHHMADDTPYGGGAGMVMKAPPIVEAVESILGDDIGSAHIAIMSAGGRPFSQSVARQLARARRVVLICGHYEGIDDRVGQILDCDELSIGDYVLTGGELPAMVVADAAIRLVPGVIDPLSVADESHNPDATAMVEYPHFTRPFTYREISVPDILVSGHHARIENWRLERARQRTARWRPDLIPNEDVRNQD